MHCRGFATEVVGAAFEWLRGARGVTAAVCIIDPANALSLRIASRFGFVERWQATYRAQPTLLLERR